MEHERLGIAREGEWLHGILSKLEYNPEWDKLPLVTKQVILGLKQPEAEDAGPAGSQQPAESGGVADQGKSPANAAGGAEQVRTNYPSLDYETRPGADPVASRRMAWNAVQDTRDAARNVRRIQAGSGKGRGGSPPYSDIFQGLGTSPEYIGSDIPEELIRNGRIDIRGQIVRNEQDLAALAQIFRDPRYETFRVIYVKDGRVVATDAISSRLPASSRTFLTDRRADAFYKQVSEVYGPDLNDWPTDLSRAYKRLDLEGQGRSLAEMSLRMERLGADGYYLLHNHPSGDPGPSAEDIKVSSLHETQVDGYRGHVVIDSGEYAFIPPSSPVDIYRARQDAMRQHTDPLFVRNLTAMELSKGKTPDVRTLKTAPDRLLQPSIPHDLLGKRAITPEDVAEIGKQIEGTGGVTLVYLSRGNVRAIETVPEKLYLNTDALAAHVRGRARISGGSEVSYSDDSPEMFDAAAKALRRGVIRDALSGQRNLRQEGAVYNKPQGRRYGYRVDE